MSQVDFCPDCGTRFGEGAASCRNCGALRSRIEATEVEAAPPQADAAALEALTAELAEALTPGLEPALLAVPCHLAAVRPMAP